MINIAIDAPTREFLQSMKALRVSKGLSQYKLADAVGTKRTNIQAYESGRNLPALPMLIVLADYLGYDLSESLNYKYFHGSIAPSKLKVELARWGLSYAEAGRLTGYSKSHVNKSLNLIWGGSMECLTAIHELIRKEKRAYAVREELAKKGKRHRA